MTLGVHNRGDVSFRSVMPSMFQCAFVAAWILANSCVGFLAASEKPHFQRWAIIASEPLQEMGFADLLAARLTRLADLELVERQELDKAISELTFAQLFGNQSTGARLKLGEMLGADALILLSLETRPASPNAMRAPTNAAAGTETTMLRVVLSDCRYGVRLRSERFEWNASRLDDTCQACAALVDTTQTHFKHGVRQVIAVTPFLSKNFLRMHDHLQVAYSTLLETALLGFPGITVVETQEVLAIRRELDLTASEIGDRVVLLYVEGDYKMLPNSTAADPSVTLSVRVSDGATQRLAVRHEGITPARVITLLADTIPRQIAELAEDVKDGGLSHAEQVALLTKRADAFSQLASFRQSIDLREAALLLAPQDTQLRLSLISEYVQMHIIQSRVRYVDSDNRSNAALGSRSGTAQRITPSGDKKRLRTEASCRRLGYHAEVVIRSGVLTPVEAHAIVSQAVFAMRSVSSRSDTEDGPTIAEEFFWRVYPLFPILDATLRDGGVEVIRPQIGRRYQTASSPQRQYNHWAGGAIHLIVVGDANHPRKLDQLFRFLTTVASPDVPLMRMATLLLTATHGDLIGMIKDGRLGESDVRAFYERLRQTGIPLHEFYGRAGLLALEVNVSRNRKWDTGTLEEIDELLQMLQSFDVGTPDDRTIPGYYERYFQPLRHTIKARLADHPQTKRHPLPTNPIPPIDPRPRIAFKPIDKVVPKWVDLLQCTDRMDVAWSCQSVVAITENGSVDQLFSIDSEGQGGTRKDEIDSVRWDGMYLWIACSSSGVWIVHPSGTKVGHLGEAEGLPPYATLNDCQRRSMMAGSRGSNSRRLQPLELHPIDPGYCLAIGNYGHGAISSVASDKRMWLATIQENLDANEGKRFELEVFHTMTDLPRTRSGAAGMNPRELFDLTWLTEYSPAGNTDRILLLGKRTNGISLSAPLAVNLNSLDVYVFPAKIPSTFVSPIVKHAINGCILQSQSSGIDVLKPGSEPTDDWIREPLRTLTPNDPDPNRIRVELLEFENEVFNPGSEWHHIDPKTWELRTLTRHPLPLRHRFQYYSVSAHWGLVAWNIGDRLFQISVDDPHPASGNLGDFYPEVPHEERAAHHKAVLAIRQLGGSVDTEWVRGTYNVSVPSVWRTIVYLDSNWKGNDQDLGCLSKLHNLRHLYMVGADISDHGMQAIGRLHKLELLHIVETRITDEGLSHLANLKQLLALRLEGHAGELGFTDKGLSNISDLNKLQRLTLYGHGFTDESMPVLRDLDFLGVIELWDTQISKESVTSIKQHRKQSITVLRDGIGL